MKSSQILASVLFGSLAAAVPFKRDLVTKTEVKVETVVVYTTVWEDELPTSTTEATTAEATTTAGGYFYEQPASSAAATTPAASSTPAYTPSPSPSSSAVQEPSSVYTPPVQTPTPSSTMIVVSSSPAPKPVETSAPAPAAPTTTEAAYTPAPVSSAAPAAPAAPSAAAVAAPASGSSSGSESHAVELTINPLPVTGNTGACGKVLYPTDMVVALAASAWGASTYDRMTGEATNPWCGKKINIEYNGKTVPATIMDLCPGCNGFDIDLSDAAWSAIGMSEWTRVKGSWSVAE